MLLYHDIYTYKPFIFTLMFVPVLSLLDSDVILDAMGYKFTQRINDKYSVVYYIYKYKKIVMLTRTKHIIKISKTCFEDSK